jgi:branched-chain amino acid transport system substrate-binding protein
MKTRKLFALALLLPLVLCTACQDKSAAPAADAPPAAASDTDADTSAPQNTEPIKIGHIVDLTGVQAMTGQEAERALNFALEALGGEFAGRPVEIVTGDAQGQPSTAVDLARKMVERDEVAAIFGPTQNDQKSAVADYIKQAKVPLIFYNAGSTELLKDNDWLVGAGGAMPQLPSVMADYAYNVLDYRTLNVISMEPLNFKSVVLLFEESFEGLGGTIVSEKWAPIPCADWMPYLTTLGDADAIVAWASGSDAISLWSAWTESGLSETMPMFGCHHGGFTDYFVPAALSNVNPAAAEAMLGALAPILYVYDAPGTENEACVKAWVEKFGAVSQSNLPGSCYQALLAFKTALEATDGNAEPDTLIKALFALDITGPEGHLTFSESQAATKDVYIAKVVKTDDGSFNYQVVKTYADVPPEGLVP